MKNSNPTLNDVVKAAMAAANAVHEMQEQQEVRQIEQETSKLARQLATMRDAFMEQGFTRNEAYGLTRSIFQNGGKN